MITTFKAVATKLPEGMQVETKSRNFTYLLDEPEELGGTDKAMNPVEALLSALGGCQAIVAAAFAEANDIKFEEFHVELEGDIDLDGFMGLSDVRPGFQEIRFVMHFKSNEPKEKLDKFVEFIEKTCPVGDTLSKGVKLVNAGVVINN
ncbi:peroxiredoxin [Candidatus Izimaplasma bacterium ZiA1]|uniref:OsmC family protein n=1 Tax=Candidatus Izimoplasma sp. ZiA1 TaxID=2024899 RepID=UPI000BAA4DC0|nr:peroxiredoxin [Candidatus Izimaplasma bacterium ZiA1]